MKKNCNKCGLLKPLDDFYSAIRKNAKGEEYVYHRPDCKECTKSKAYEWAKNNYETYRKSFTKRNNKEEYKKKIAESSKKRRENGKMREWARKNKDKVKRYNFIRYNKNHDITKEEWLKCKEFFNNECAYCGMTEKEHKEKYNQQLHKEHVIHDGSNKIDNCIPACRSCNSSKGTYDLDEWYKGKEFYDSNRQVLINEWLSSFVSS
ncbi:HNH endonuclease [Priestia megaterium]|uniref:HNH endonuclease n=1 Tax=Priestia megaterium TaxID=1404 RepID=UPI003CC68907